MEASVCCKDGSYRHIEFHLSSFGDSNLISFVDLTDRRRAELQLRESEERFRLVANTAPVMIWVVWDGRNNAATSTRPGWTSQAAHLRRSLAMVGQEEFIGTITRHCLQTYTEALKRREPFEMQYRLRRKDGEYRWILDNGVPRFDSDGTFAGYIGSCIDITERKLAEEALATIGRRLIEAHEEERTWIGRELHDDINQRLALLAVELDRWSQSIPSAQNSFANPPCPAACHSRLRRMCRVYPTDCIPRNSNIWVWPPPPSSFCRELAGQSKVEIQFSHSGIPRSVPKEVSLCLFRVLQEALQNAVKHSGVRSFTVDLRGTEEAIELTVTDIGRGFEEQEAFTRDGLGLISMRERLQLVHGELSVKSKTGAGTTIHARVPLRAQEYRAMAG